MVSDGRTSSPNWAWRLISNNWKLTFSFLGAAAWFLIAAGLLIAWWNGTVAAFSLLGTACGWVAGVLLAPYEGEQRRFKAISKGVSGIIAGYGLAKFDKVFDILTDRANGTPLILTTSFARSAFLGFGCFLVMTITVFVARSYWQLAAEESD